MRRARWLISFAAGLPLALLMSTRAEPTPPSSPAPPGLEIREIQGGSATNAGSIAPRGTAVPRDAVEVFTYDGQPQGVRVAAGQIAVDYGRSGVLFDRATGKLASRLTLADGWPEVRPGQFPPSWKHADHLVGPGVLDSRSERPFPTPGKEARPIEYRTVATAEFDGRTWRAMQPAGFLGGLPMRFGHDYNKFRKEYGTWTAILKTLNTESSLEATPRDGGAAVRYTMKDGLASNIVTHLVAADGRLWAACVDIYDPETKQWGPGGLCWLDPKVGRWQRLDRIANWPVRWVTLLENRHGKLWVGFRVGDGIAGDQVVYGMGLYPGDYRPATTAVVLARLSEGQWKSYLREPLPTSPIRAERAAAKDPSTERPRTLALLGNKALLFSQTFARATGNWDVSLEGHISTLDLTSGAWRQFDIRRDFDAFHLEKMVAEEGEILALTDRGVHRWSAADEKWQFLDPQSPIQNPALSAAVAVGDELWLGYTNESFGVIGRQGISRFDEKTRRWSHISPQEIGTAAPVRNIAATADGDVWVLFKRRPWFGAAMEFSFYMDQAWNAPEGLARYHGGKWQFPAKLDGVPESRRREWKLPGGLQRTGTDPLPIEHIAGVGDKLFVANGEGVFAGPGKWRQIFRSIVPTTNRAGPPWANDFTEDRIMAMQPTDDGKGLQIWHVGTETNSRGTSKQMRSRYDLATGNLKTEPAENDWYSAISAGYLLSSPAYRAWNNDWLEVPVKRPGRWAVGRLGSRAHALIATPHAVWIASQGELIRLERQKLGEWF